MSMRYPGGFIASTPVTAAYPSGVWTQAQAIPYQAQNVWTRDQFWPYTTLLLQGNGTNGAQNNTFLDSSSNNFTITRNGNTTQGSFTPYEQDGYWSNYFGGSSDWLSTANNAAFDFGSGDFTVECFAYFNSVSAAQTFFARWRINQYGFIFQYDPAAGLTFIYSTTGSGAGNVSRTYSTTLSAGQWYHIAFARSGGSTRAFVNGVQVGSTTSDNVTIFNSNQPQVVGIIRDDALFSPMNGYISNLRVLKGTALYTSNFTVPTIPLTAVTNTVLLTCQSNRFKDNSTNNFTLTVNGSPSVQAFQPFPGATTWSASVLGGSGYFDGSGDYLTTADNAALEVGAGDFTAEAWFYPTSLAASYNFVFGKWTSANTDRSFGVFVTNTGSIEAYWTRAGGIDNSVTTATGLVVANAWNHIAFVRNGNVFTVYVNGASSASKTDAITVYDSSVAYSEGAESGGTYPITGYLASARLVKGTAVYTSTFTPPTTPLTAITNTSLLLNFTNAGIFDSAVMNDLETVGNAQVSTSVVKYGTGSMAFDGSGDYLFVPTNQNMNFGSGNFTIEMWIYPLSVSSFPYLIDGRSTSTASENVVTLYVDSSQYVTYWVNGAARITANSTVSLNAWSHVAVVKNGGITTMYLNGTPVGTWTDGTTYVASNYLIGQRTATSSQSWNGYIDDLRITKGAARYITNFTPPPARMPGQ